MCFPKTQRKPHYLHTDFRDEERGAFGGEQHLLDGHLLLAAHVGRQENFAESSEKE